MLTHGPIQNVNQNVSTDRRVAITPSMLQQTKSQLRKVGGAVIETIKNNPHKTASIAGAAVLTSVSLGPVSLFAGGMLGGATKVISMVANKTAPMVVKGYEGIQTVATELAHEAISEFQKRNEVTNGSNKQGTEMVLEEKQEKVIDIEENLEIASVGKKAPITNDKPNKKRKRVDTPDEQNDFYVSAPEITTAHQNKRTKRMMVSMNQKNILQDGKKRTRQKPKF